MKQEYALSLLQHMVQIPSVSGDESALASYLAHEMETLGFRCAIDGVGNVVGEKGNDDGPTIMLLGHMDTVPGLIEVRQEGSLLYGRGTVDAKGPLATLLCACAQADETRARLIVVGAVEEETAGSRGAHYLLDRYKPDAVIIGEPSGWSNVVLGYKGRMGLHYEVKRPQAHTAKPGEKATEIAVQFWHDVTQYLQTVDKDKSLFYRTIATLRSFNGDTSQARLTIDCRTKPDFDFSAFEEFLHTVSHDAQLQIDECTPSILMDRNVPPARALISSIRTHNGRPTFKLKTGTSDMNIVSKRWNVPMVAYGPGDSRLDHTSNEHIDTNEYLFAITVLRDALPLLATTLREQASQNVYTADEEGEVTQRLEALGYL
jgi:[amino group carrier protein]-lysine/ornithine hydrolase